MLLPLASGSPWNERWKLGSVEVGGVLARIADHPRLEVLFQCSADLGELLAGFHPPTAPTNGSALAF